MKVVTGSVQNAKYETRNEQMLETDSQNKKKNNGTYLIWDSGLFINVYYLTSLYHV